MSPDTAMRLAGDALFISIKLAGPFLLAGLVVGVLVSVFQAATQIQEMTLQLIPKIMVTIMVIALGGPWMMASMITYTQDLFNSIPTIVQGR